MFLPRVIMLKVFCAECVTIKSVIVSVINISVVMMNVTAPSQATFIMKMKGLEKFQQENIN